MPFTTPLALLGLLFVPAVIAMYLLKLRRDEAVVPSTLLWTRLVADVEANAPWQRLRRSLLLLLQLLLVIALALLAARPFLERPAGLARDIVLVMDTSASMAATDVVPDRLTAAKQVAIDALKDLPTGGKVSLIAADRTARIVVNESGDLTRVRQAIESIPVTESRGDLGDALELASKLAARSGDAQILVATDAALASKPTGRVAAPVKVLSVGRDRKNQAIVALAVRTAPSAVTRSVFVSVANLDLTAASRRLELWGDDRLLEVRDVKLDPQARSDVIIDDLPREVGTVEVRLVGAGSRRPGRARPTGGRRPRVGGHPARPHAARTGRRRGRPLPRDRAVVPPRRRAVRRHARRVRPRDASARTVDRGTSSSSRASCPRPCRRRRSWPSRRHAASPLGDVSGTLKNPASAALDPDEPVLRYVDLSTTHVAEAAKLTAPTWARTVMPGPAGAPLLYSGTRDGPQQRRPRLRAAPVRPAAPGRLPDPSREPDRRAARGSTAPTEAVDPGTPVQLHDPARRGRAVRHRGPTAP